MNMFWVNYRRRLGQGYYTSLNLAFNLTNKYFNKVIFIIEFKKYKI